MGRETGPAHDLYRTGQDNYIGPELYFTLLLFSFDIMAYDDSSSVDV